MAINLLHTLTPDSYLIKPTPCTVHVMIQSIFSAPVPVPWTEADPKPDNNASILMEKILVTLLKFQAYDLLKHDENRLPCKFLF